jgi:hypothetical protein
MAPPSILHSAVDQVAAKLSVDIPKEVIQAAKESLRLLETRVKTGKLGKGDKSETRAAILLEYAMRQKLGRKLAVSELATAVGLKKVNLEHLHTIVGNYLQKPAVAASNKRNIPSRQLLSTAAVAQTAGLRQQAALQAPTQQQQQLQVERNGLGLRTRTEQLPQSTVNELAVRLNAHVADPRGVAKAAAQLLVEIRTLILESLQVHEKRGSLYDMSRYWPAYEAAAFYYCKDKDCDLELEDLVEASNQCTLLELKNHAWPNVKMWAERLHEQKEQQQQTKNNKMTRGSRPVSVSSSSAKDDSGVDEGDDNRDKDVKPASLDPEESLRMWREQILSSAIEKARQGHEDLSENAALAIAADTVLRKHGLLKELEP